MGIIVFTLCTILFLILLVQDPGAVFGGLLVAFIAIMFVAGMAALALL